MKVDKGRDYITLYNERIRIEFRCHFLATQRMQFWFDVVHLGITHDKQLSKLTASLFGFEMNLGIYH